MSNYLLGAIGCLCLLHTGVCADECVPSILAVRDTIYVPAGGSLSLSCVVQHCGNSWKGNWVWRDSNSILSHVTESARHRVTFVTLSANKTQQILNVLLVNQSDEGYYGYRVVWDQGHTDMGHLMFVNITAAVSSQRSVSHRVLVCAAASLCLPVILVLARCLSSKVKPQPKIHAAVYRERLPAPQPPPRCPIPQKRSTSSRKVSPALSKHVSSPSLSLARLCAAPLMSQQKTEVVYADISQGAPRREGTAREPPHATVYSSLRFP